MRPLLLLIAATGLILPLAAAETAPPDTHPSTDLPPSQVSAETLTLDDGSVFTGVYNSDTQQLTLINATTGTVYGSMHLTANRIVARKDLTITVPSGAAVATGPAQAPGTGGRWTESLADALASAKAASHPILIDFTGSDWSSLSKLLHAEVLDQPEFKAWAATHVVLLRADFPRGSELPAALRDQNAKLAAAFEVGSYPTELLVGTDGRTVLARSGYLAGGPKPWIANLSAQARLP